MIDCIRCGKTYKSIKLFLTHLERGKNCIEECISIPKKHYKNNYEQINNIFYDDYKDIKDNNRGLKYGCEHCGKLYSSYSYSYEHKKTYCKENSEPNNNIQTNIQDSQNTNTNTESLNTHISTNSNVNTPNHSQNTNASNNTITINNYGTPIDVTQLPTNIKRNIISNPLQAITRMCETAYVYIPQNRNVYIKDSKEGYGMIYENGEWNKVPMNTLISDIVENSADYVTDICGDNTFNKSNNVITKINKHFDNVCKDDYVAKTEKNNVKYTLDNYSPIIRKHYAKLLNKHVKLNLKPLC